jgi:hypothetical protein
MIGRRLSAITEGWYLPLMTPLRSRSLTLSLTASSLRAFRMKPWMSVASKVLPCSLVRCSVAMILPFSGRSFVLMSLVFQES